MLIHYFLEISKKAKFPSLLPFFNRVVPVFHQAMECLTQAAGLDECRRVLSRPIQQRSLNGTQQCKCMAILRDFAWISRVSCALFGLVFNLSQPNGT